MKCGRSNRRNVGRRLLHFFSSIDPFGHYVTHILKPPSNKTLDASGTSGLVIDILSVTQLSPAASTQPLGIFFYFVNMIIDGIKVFVDDNSGKAKCVIVQVKSGDVKSGDIRDLVGARDREGGAACS